MGPLHCRAVHTGLWDCLGTPHAMDRAKDDERKGLGALSSKSLTPAGPGEQPCPCHATSGPQCRQVRGSTPSQGLLASVRPRSLQKQSTLMLETSLKLISCSIGRAARTSYRRGKRGEACTELAVTVGLLKWAVRSSRSTQRCCTARAALQLKHAVLQGIPRVWMLSHIIQPLPSPFPGLCHVPSQSLVSLKDSAALTPETRNCNAAFQTTNWKVADQAHAHRPWGRHPPASPGTHSVLFLPGLATRKRQ